MRDEAAQQDLTGMSAAETLASLNRDTSDTLNTLKPIFDKEKIEAGFESRKRRAGRWGSFWRIGRHHCTPKSRMPMSIW